MKLRFRLLGVLVAGLMVLGNQSLRADVVYEADFGTFTDGDLAGQDGWEAQLPWQVTGGMVTCSSSWVRARQVAAGFSLQPGELVRFTTEMTLTGVPGTPVFARLGLAKSNETTGAELPQVGADVSWSGTNLNIGGVVDTGYDSGDLIRVELTFIMRDTADSWHVNVRLNNVTDGTSVEGGLIPIDLAGAITPETAWGWLNAGMDGNFGLRMLNNAGGIEVALANVKFENNLPEEEFLPVVVHSSNFCDFADGGLASQNGWEGQAPWVVSGGVLTTSSSWARARQLSAFGIGVGETIRYTFEGSFTGTPNGAEIARVGISSTPEHTGTNIPQVFGGIVWDGTNLTVGGATDPGYDSGDNVSVSLTIRRGAAAGQWFMNTRIENTTDGTSFAASSNPTDLIGSVSAATVWDNLDAGGAVYPGFRAFDNSAGVEIGLKSVLVEAGLEAEPPFPSVVFETDFCELVDGALAGQDDFEAQAPWVIAGGMATTTASFVRARKIGANAFVLNVDETLGINAELSFTGTPGAAPIFNIGFAKNNEHTGAVIPQVGASATWVGSDLTIGGATDTGYDSGDVLNVEFRFTRGAAADSWILETTIDNVTDGTSFTGMDMPTDLPGSVSTETAWGWLDAGNTLFVGMAAANNTGGVEIAIKTISAVTNPEDVPVVEGGDFFADTMEVIRGIQTGGDVTVLELSDNVDFVTQRNPTQLTGVVELEAKAISPIQNPTRFDFRIEGAGFFRSTVIQSVEFYDFDLGEFVEVDSRDARRFADSTTDIIGTGDLSRFVDDATGCVRAKILYTSVARRQAFSAAVDQIFWTIE